jgi:hypothetical protein
VEHCLDIDSMPRVIKVLEDELLLDQVEAIMDMPNGLNFLLEHQRIEGGRCRRRRWTVSSLFYSFWGKCRRRQCRNRLFTPPASYRPEKGKTLVRPRGRRAGCTAKTSADVPRGMSPRPAVFGVSPPHPLRCSATTLVACVLTGARAGSCWRQ